MLRSRRGALRALGLPPLLAAVLLAGCGSSSPHSSITVGSEGNGSSTTSATTGGGSSPRAGYPAGCRTATAPTPKGPQHIPRPTVKLNPSKTYTVTITTNCGQIGIRLAVAQAPKTSSSFAYLVGRGFYNGLTFQRVAADFVIQGGDPLGNGTGGPGYQVVEPPPANLKYTVGTVAMAKTAADPSGASGSQFFIIVGSQGATLPPQYALVGHVVSGMSIAQRIGTVSTNPPGDGQPVVPMVIQRASLTTSG